MTHSKEMKRHKRGRRQKSWPLILLIGGGLILIFAAVSFLSKPSKPGATIEVTGAPSLKVDKQEVNLGNVKLDRTVEVTFEITNVGDQNLRFTKTPYIEVVEGC